MKNSSILPESSELLSDPGHSSGGVSGTVRITGQFGLHARPAAQLVKVAQQYNCTVQLRTSSGKADAKSILDILSLAAGPGSEVHIHTDGPDEKDALQTMLKFFESF